MIYKVTHIGFDPKKNRIKVQYDRDIVAENTNEAINKAIEELRQRYPKLTPAVAVDNGQVDDSVKGRTVFSS